MGPCPAGRRGAHRHRGRAERRRRGAHCVLRAGAAPAAAGRRRARRRRHRPRRVGGRRRTRPPVGLPFRAADGGACDAVLPPAEARPAAAPAVPTPRSALAPPRVARLPAQGMASRLPVQRLAVACPAVAAGGGACAADHPPVPEGETPRRLRRRPPPAALRSAPQLPAPQCRTRQAATLPSPLPAVGRRHPAALFLIPCNREARTLPCRRACSNAVAQAVRRSSFFCRWASKGEPVHPERISHRRGVDLLSDEPYHCQNRRGPPSLVPRPSERLLISLDFEQHATGQRTHGSAPPVRGSEPSAGIPRAARSPAPRLTGSAPAHHLVERQQP